MRRKTSSSKRRNEENFSKYLLRRGAWGSVVVKALRYYSEGTGIDSQWCHWILQ